MQLLFWIELRGVKRFGLNFLVDGIYKETNLFKDYTDLFEQMYYVNLTVELEQLAGRIEMRDEDRTNYIAAYDRLFGCKKMDSIDNDHIKIVSTIIHVRSRFNELMDKMRKHGINILTFENNNSESTEDAI